MKIFISHSSANKDYGNLLVDLLRGIGIKEKEIIFTSNTAYGIPIAQNIFNWLKSQISEKPFVIYLLSKEYYSSIACLNEMGAAWVIENEHAMLFTPNFDINSKEFQNGAIDPREIGFYINDEERLLSFIQHLNLFFEISNNTIIINQVLKKYLSAVNLIIDRQIHIVPNLKSLNVVENKVSETFPKVEEIENINLSSVKTVNEQKTKPEGIYQKFLNEITTGKLNDSELLLLHYIVDLSKIALYTGWQEDAEVRNIKEWEEIRDINNTLSSNYGSALRKFGLRNYTEVSALTSSNNPKEVKLKSAIADNILDLPQIVLDTINKIVDKNKGYEKPKQVVDDLPF